MKKYTVTIEASFDSPTADDAANAMIDLMQYGPLKVKVRDNEDKSTVSFDWSRYSQHV
jgi:hypothetical protein